MGMKEQRILMGNEAIGRGLVEEGCTLAAAYPGTPASEILASGGRLRQETGAMIHTEWSINEKVACETALANAMAGRRSAVAMKQVGLNVAADPFTRATYLGVKGGFILIAADDPGRRARRPSRTAASSAFSPRRRSSIPVAPRGAGDGDRGLRAFGAVRDPRHPPADDAGLPRPPECVCRPPEPHEEGAFLRRTPAAGWRRRSSSLGSTAS